MDIIIGLILAAIFLGLPAFAVIIILLIRSSSRSGKRERETFESRVSELVAGGKEQITWEVSPHFGAPNENEVIDKFLDHGYTFTGEVGEPRAKTLLFSRKQ